MISVALYQTIQEWHAADVEKREIARRLRLDIKTVRRHIRKIDAGAAAPARVSPGSKLDPYAERSASPHRPGVEMQADFGELVRVQYAQTRTR